MVEEWREAVQEALNADDEIHEFELDELPWYAD